MARPAGIVEKKPRATAARKMAADALKSVEGGSKLTPLNFMLSILRNRKQPIERRMWAAEKAAPFLHPRLANVQHQSADEDGVYRIEIKSVPPDTKS